jgi:hypothetical protein
VFIRNAALTDAIVGSSVAIVMIVLDNSNLGRISIPLHILVDRAIFTVCPLYVLGFTKAVSNKATWFLATISGNAVLYGAAFAGVAGILSLFKRSAV